MADPVKDAVAAHSRHLAKIAALAQQQAGRIQSLEDNIRELLSRPRSPVEAIDAIPGRRIESTLGGTVAFDATSRGTRGAPVTMQVSQDGPFVATHYPLVLWTPTLPTTATNFGRWRPVATFPLPDQVVDEDILDLAYEIVDSGPGRNFQNTPRGPLFSRPDAIMPLPMPTLWAPNSVVQFVPTYNAITFNGATPPTQGTLWVTIPGYRIVNL